MLFETVDMMLFDIGVAPIGFLKFYSFEVFEGMFDMTPEPPYNYT